MPLYLCKNEKILKNWTFASEEAGNGTYSHNLTVTNKRMVATSASPNSISRTEIPIDSVALTAVTTQPRKRLTTTTAELCLREFYCSLPV